MKKQFALDGLQQSATIRVNATQQKNLKGGGDDIVTEEFALV
ncbi:MAG: hypothetical protein AAFW73_07510 [Bacteroidota bacterium]